MADNSELMTDLKSCQFCARAYVSCSNSKCKVFTPVTEAGEVSEAEVEAAMKAFVLVVHDITSEAYDDDLAAATYPKAIRALAKSREAIRAALLAARRVQPKQDAPSPDVAGLIEALRRIVACHDSNHEHQREKLADIIPLARSALAGVKP